MTARSLQAGVLVRAPRPVVFRWIADHRNARRVLEGVREWEPVDPRRSTGAGARFRVRIAVLGITAGAILELDAWDEPDRIGWHAEGGPVRVRGRWDLAEHPAGTDVRLHLEYEPPGGLLGALGAGRLAGIGRHRLDAGLEAMRRALEDGAT